MPLSDNDGGRKDSHGGHGATEWRSRGHAVVLHGHLRNTFDLNLNFRWGQSWVSRLLMTFWAVIMNVRASQHLADHLMGAPCMRYRNVPSQSALKSVGVV